MVCECISCLLQVSSNGFFTFDSEDTYNAEDPQLFSSTSPLANMVAPFWASNDIISRTGSISYEVHNSVSSGGYLEQVSSFISQSQQVRFEGTWMIVAEWRDVSQFNGSYNDSESDVRISNSNLIVFTDWYTWRIFKSLMMTGTQIQSLLLEI